MSIKKKKAERRTRWISLLISEILIMIPKVVILFQAIPFADVRDEVSMLAVPAYLAGCDWSECINAGGSYYGFGYFFLFAPLFRTNLGMIWIYRIILCVTALLEGIIPVIVHYILCHYLKFRSKFLVILITVIVSFITTNPLYNLFNEHILVLIIWGVTLAAFKLVYAETKKERLFHTLLLDILLIYGLFLHTRFQVLLIAVCMAVIIYRFFYKEWIVSPVFFIVLGVGFFISQYIIHIVQITVWGTAELSNTSAGIPAVTDFNSLKLLTGFFKVILGNTGTFIIFTASCGIFVFGALICFFYHTFIKSRSRKKTDKSFFFILCIFILSTGGILTALGLQHMKAFSVSSNGEKFYAIKMLTYLRYYILFVIPLLFIGIILYCNAFSFYRKTYKYSLVFALGILMLWIYFIAPEISDTYYGMSTFYPFSYLLNLKVRLGIDDFRGIINIILPVPIFLIILSKKKKLIVLLFTAFLFIYQYTYFAIEIALPQEKIYYHERSESIDYIMENIKAEQPIYVYDASKMNFFFYQGYLYQYKIAVKLPDDFDTDAVVLSNKEIDEMLPDYMEGIKLSDKEWVYYYSHSGS